MCVLSIKMPIRKKSGNLFNDPHNSCDFLRFLKQKIHLNGVRFEDVEHFERNKKNH